jgi:excinuclease ABC subunit C
MEKFKFLSRKKINQLPKDPGVYCFKDSKKILYIGKAANIRERVKNHFSQPAYRDNFFINQVKKIGYIKTSSELAEPLAHLTSHLASQGSTIEALILEANLIKKYRPKYNVLWRDDKNYFFVGITEEDFPRIFITHQPAKDANFVGPFVDGKALKQTLKILRKVFPYRTCKTLPKHPCLWYQLNRCLAPCILETELGKQLERYRISIIRESQRNVKNLLKILQGKKKQVLNELKKEMKKNSAAQDYEKAAKIRDQIRSLEKVLAHTRIFEGYVKPRSWQYIAEVLKKILRTRKKIFRIEAYDVSNIQGQEATGSMVTFINGFPDKNFYRKFKIKTSEKPNDTAMIKEILSRRFGHPEWPFPDLILIDGGKSQLNAAKETKRKEKRTKNILVIAIAKRENDLFIENRRKPILLKSLPREIFNLILQLRDEAHRFAISYHKKLREVALHLKS